MKSTAYIRRLLIAKALSVLARRGFVPSKDNKPDNKKDN